MSATCDKPYRSSVVIFFVSEANSFCTVANTSVFTILFLLIRGSASTGRLCDYFSRLSRLIAIRHTKAFFLAHFGTILRLICASTFKNIFMKKLIIFLPVLFIVTLVFPNNLSLFSRAQKVNKEINLSIFSGSNYNTAAYDDANATVEITVNKINGNKKTVLSRQSYKAVQLKQYPFADKAITKMFTVNSLMGNNEILMITYTISYNSNGSVITFENNQVLNKNTSKDDINISI